jgi:transcriptional regulator with XRE-family HTH domain
MTHIIPQVLKALRERRQLSQDQLAKKAQVDKQTIHRIERGMHKRTRAHTIQQLADALKTKADILTGAEPMVEDKAKPTVFEPTELKTQMSAATRNALSLVAAKYGVGQRRIVELAPFLFAWACEASLGRRWERISAIEASYKSVAAHSGNFPHLSHLLTDNWRGEVVIGAEQESITKRDIFGELIPFTDGEIGNSDADEWSENPFAVFLSSLSAEIGAHTHFEGFDRNTSPDYVICKDQALQMVDGDEYAAEVIITGAARLHEMPAEVRQGSGAERTAWLTAEHERRDAEIRTQFPELGGMIDDLLAGAGQ